MNVHAPSSSLTGDLKFIFISPSSASRRCRRRYFTDSRHLLEPDLLGTGGRSVRKSVCSRRFAVRPIAELNRVAGIADDGLAGDYIFARKRLIACPNPQLPVNVRITKRQVFAIMA